jgi:hypothetical protein
MALWACHTDQPRSAGPRHGSTSVTNNMPPACRAERGDGSGLGQAQNRLAKAGFEGPTLPGVALSAPGASFECSGGVVRLRLGEDCRMTQQRNES